MAKDDEKGRTSRLDANPANTISSLCNADQLELYLPSSSRTKRKKKQTTRATAKSDLILLFGLDRLMRLGS